MCYFEDPNDIDGDGVENNPDGAMSSSAYGGSFLADEDNCSEAPNGPFLGTCTKGNLGSTCIADQACGDDGICSMNKKTPILQAATFVEMPVNVKVTSILMRMMM